MARSLKSVVPPSPLSNTRDEEKRGHSKTKDLSHVPCKFFKAGQCTAGAACPFSHTLAEPGQPKKVCQWFVTGTCRFGHKCALAHILPGESMSMDRKNKKAAQQQAQASSSQQTQQSDQARNSQSDARSTTSVGTLGGGGGRPTRKDRDRDRPSRRVAGGPKSSSSTRDRTLDRRDNDSNSSPRAEENNMLSSVATLRPPIRIGKGPTTSASVTAPPVLGDTSATAFSQSNDLEVDRSWATASLEQVQGHSRQNTIMPATETLALSDYSKTPSATVSDLPPSTSAAVAPPISSPPKKMSQGSPLNSTSRSGADIPSATSYRNGGGGGDADYIGSPQLMHVESPRNKFGPIGSPPPASGNGSTAAASPGRGALSSIMAGLSIGQGVSVYNNQQSRPHRPEMSEVKYKDEAPSSVTSQSSLHAHMNANILGTSPFSMPGSRSLFMSYPGTGEPSSVTSPSNIPHYLGGGHGALNGGVPASFAGSRAMGWGTTGDARRPSLPGHHQRPSLSGSSIRSSGLDGNAFEEEDDEGGEGLEAEEFLPSSLNNLLTKEERARKFSRSGAKPTKEFIIGRRSGGGSHDDDGDDDTWNDTLRHRPTMSSEQKNLNFSRSVPATSLLGMGNPRAVRSLWENEGGNAPASNGVGVETGQQPRYIVMARTVSSNAATGHDGFGSLSDSYGPSPSTLSSSVMSNSSNAFLRSSRIGTGNAGQVGVYGGDGNGGRLRTAGGGVPAGNDLHIGSYNPQSSLYPPQPPISHAPHRHQHSSISGISSGALQSHTQAQKQALSTQSGNQYSMYSGPSDLNSANVKPNAAAYYNLHQQPLPHHPHHPSTAAPAAHGEGAHDLRHEPGQSLPRGLGAGLSRIHFVPAASLGSGVGSPTPGATFGSPGVGLASPPGYASFSMGGTARGGPAGIDTTNLNDFGGKHSSTTPTRGGYGSGLTARLAAAGIGSRNGNLNSPVESQNPPPSQGIPGAMNIHNVRNINSTWGSGRAVPHGNVDDVDVDEGTLFNMD